MSEKSDARDERGETDSNNDSMYPVVPSDQLDEGERVMVEVNGIEIAVFKTDDEYYAVANYCPHQAGPLCEGPLSGDYSAEKNAGGWELKYNREGEVISCPWHGWEFDIKTGEHTAHSQTKTITYDVVDKDGHIYIDY